MAPRLSALRDWLAPRRLPGILAHGKAFRDDGPSEPRTDQLVEYALQIGFHLLQLLAPFRPIMDAGVGEVEHAVVAAGRNILIPDTRLPSRVNPSRKPRIPALGALPESSEGVPVPQ